MGDPTEQEQKRRSSLALSANAFKEMLEKFKQDAIFEMTVRKGQYWKDGYFHPLPPIPSHQKKWLKDWDWAARASNDIVDGDPPTGGAD